MGRAIVKYLSWRQWEQEPLTQLQQSAECEEDVGWWREDAGAGHTGQLVTLPGSARSPAG